MQSVQQRADITDADFSLYLKNRKRLSEAHERAAAIQNKIAAAEEAQARALTAAPESAAVKQQAEDLAAAIALGQATPGEAQKCRAEIEKLEALLAKGLATARAAGEAISGLERMLAKTQSEIESLEAEGRELLRQTLRECAERIGAEYLKHAQGAYRAYLRLMALHLLVRQVGGGEIASLHAQKFFLPAFYLNGFEQLRHPHSQELFSDSGCPLYTRIEKAAETELQQLRAIGVEL